MNILHITNNLNNNTETFIRSFIYSLNKEQNVSLIIYHKAKKEYNSILQNNVYEFSQNRFQKILKKLKNKFKFKDSQTTCLRSFAINKKHIEHADLFFIDYTINLIEIFQNIKKFDKPVYVFIHGYDVSKAFRNRNFISLFEDLVNLSNLYFVSPCQFFLNKLKLSFFISDKQLMLLPYGLDYNLVNSYKINGLPNNIRFNMLFVGRFVNKKNPLALIEMLHLLVNMMGLQNIRLTMIGGGELEPVIKNKIFEYKLHEKVVLLGILTQEEVFKQLAVSDIYIQHSVTDFEGDQEGLPNAILEALAMNVPVVSTIHSGIPEVVKDGYNGFLVQENDFQNMAKIVYDLITKPDRLIEIRKNIMDDTHTLYSNEQRVLNLIHQIFKS
jgi:colanic acid/amylovoran biosynthesis glycosyltransferase